MNYKIYIQACNNFPVADWAVSAYMGFKERQANIYFFEDIEEVPVSPYNVVVSFIEDTNKYFAKLGIPPKKNFNIPESLFKYAGRGFTYDNLGHIRMLAFTGRLVYPFFLKPVYAKRFVAGIIKNDEQLRAFLKDIPDTEEVMVSTIVNFISEYRGYVVKGELKGIKHYIGDFRVFPDMKIIDAAVADFKDAPAGYSIDFGITDKGETLLVECNDGWSLGNYGLEDSKYVSLLVARWLELMKEIKK